MLRPRLTYANVVATLALFIALGGTSVAATNLLSGSRIKKDSIPANRIRKHSLTSAEVNVAKLGTVPVAASANNAFNAAHANTADQATHAATADAATHAVSADTVGGLPAAAFAPDTRLLAGAADPRSATPQTIVDSPLGFRLQTDGNPNFDRTVTLVNTTADNWAVIDTSGAGVVLPGAKAVLHQGNSPMATADSNEITFLYQAIPLPRRFAHVDCWFPSAGGAETLTYCSATEVAA